jgi:Skp family chaperone for outer membrane proteins
MKEQNKKAMKRIYLLVAALLLAALTIVSASAQTAPRPAAGTPRPAATPAAAPPAATPSSAAAAAPVPAAKIAYIDTGVFGDKAGINKYINAVKSLEREFKPREDELTGLQTRMKGVSDELAKLRSAGVVDQKTIQARQDEGERLQREWKFKKDSADADFARRYGEVVSPILTDIGKAVEQFAATRSITMVIDISKLAPALLMVNPSMDVTQAFIADYNSKHP